MSQRDERLRKLDAMRARGVDPYPARFARTHEVADLHAKHAALEDGTGSGETVSVAGRVMSRREAGKKLAFLDLVDASGKVQLFVTGAAIESLDDIDTGDWVGATGEVIRSKAGELSVKPDVVVLLSKAVRPLPDTWHGLSNVEVRYRQRYLDLIANDQARTIARTRIKTVRAIREFLDARGFEEVETPLLQPIPGGGSARPFVTHHNTLDVDMYLRIAPELYLKRLVVGGMERVYEIGRNFRNEGVSVRHNPEFTMLEVYQAYADYFDVMDLFEEIIEHAALAAAGTLDVGPISFKRPWKRISVIDAVSEATGVDIDLGRGDELRALCAKHKIHVEPWWGPGTMLDELRDTLVEPACVNPTILYDYPLEVSPLARTHRSNPLLTERFEVICGGHELGNAFSELNDPIEQRRRFDLQAAQREAGDEEAPPPDEDYLRALEFGLPPTGGLGIGIDRLVMYLTQVSSIREVVLFPAMRPEDGARAEEGDDAE